MDDIRKNKYSLKAAPKLPEHLRKDTHDIMLDLIRLRPRLNPVSLPISPSIFGTLTSTN